MRILIVEDDDVLRSLLVQRLSTAHYAVDAVADAQQGWEYASLYDYDLLILDVVLPGMDGVTLCKRLRSQHYTLPILLLTAQDTRDSKRMGWEAGADDYVVKPFDEEELVARIRALLRRSHANPLPILTWGPLWLDTNTCEASYNDITLSLTAKEYTLLEMMLRDSQHVFSNEDIMEGLWASEEFPTEATVRSHIRRLRRKLSTAGAPTDLIATSHGRGYYLKPIDTDLPSALPVPSGLPSPQSFSVPSSLNTPTPPQRASAASAGSLSSMAPTASPAEIQTQYAQLLQQTWVQYSAECWAKVAALKEAIASLSTAGLPPQDQATAYRLAHTLAGTLGTLGLKAAMRCAWQLEQTLHPDLYIDSTQAIDLGYQVSNLEQAIKTEALAIEQGAMGHDAMAQDGMAQDGMAQEAIGHEIIGQEAIGQNAIGHEIIGQEAIGQNAIGQEAIGQEAIGQDAIAQDAIQQRPIPAMPSSLASSSSTSSLSPSPPTRLMLVDDDPIFLQTMLGQLQCRGFHVSILADPQQFWVVLDTVAPEVLVLDVQMPHCSGLELCQSLRLAPEWQKLPVMFLSILGDADVQHQAFAVGADDYLSKPISAQHLGDRIRQRLQRVHAVSQ